MSSAGAAGRPWRSAIVAGAESGHHHLTIHGYSRTKGVPTGDCLESLPFTIGGHRWRIRYYPNGMISEVAEYISLALFLDQDVEETLKVQWDIDLVGEEEDATQVALASVDNFASWRGWRYKTFIKRGDLESSKYLRNDSFTIRCDIVVIHDYSAVVDAAFVDVPPCDLSRHLGDLLETKKGTDVVFKVGGETLTAHRCILAARSSVFAAELFGPMMEGSTAAGVVVQVEDMEAEVFKALLHFAYTDSLPETRKEHENVACQHLLVAADRYGMERLKLICEEKLCKYIDVGSAAIILALAEQHHCEGLKKACFNFLAVPANLKAVIATDGFQHLNRSCPSIMVELMAMSVAH